MNLIDRLLKPWAPDLVARRLAAREAIQAYEAARPGRTHKAKRQPLGADTSLQKSAVSMREQCRKLDEDHDLVTGLLDRLEERVVGGSGIGVEPLPLRLDGSVHAELAMEIRSAWAEWSLSPETSGELTRPQVERLMCRTWLRDGEGLAQKLMGRVPNYTFATSVPFALELLEPDYLPFSYNNLSKGIVQGIERDTWRRKRAYHLLKDHPGNLQTLGGSLAVKRVEAERIIHIAYRKRIGQNRGVPMLHAVLIRLADLKDYEESERVAARISAALAMYIKKGNPDSYTVEPGKDRKNRTIPIAPGMVFDDLEPGEDVGMIESNRPNPFLEGFRNGQLRMIGAGTRSTYSSVSRPTTAPTRHSARNWSRAGWATTCCSTSSSTTGAGLSIGPGCRCTCWLGRSACPPTLITALSTRRSTRGRSCHGLTRCMRPTHGSCWSRPASPMRRKLPALVVEIRAS